MAKSFKKLGKRMKELGVQIEKGSIELTKKVALAIDSAIVIATPVDEGRARSNWQVNLGTPAQGTREPYFPGEAGSTEAQNTQAAIDAGKAIINGYKGGTSINITSNLDYIEPLNKGHSAQAPEGFIEKAILVGQQAVANTRIIK